MKKVIKLLRKIKAYYILIFVVLAAGGGGYFLYTKDIQPKLAALRTAADNWKTAKTAAEEAHSGIESIMDSYQTNADLYLENLESFEIIQSKQPLVYNYASLKATDPDNALRQLYDDLTSNRLVNVLTRWSRVYPNVSNPPIFSFSGIIGYEDTLTDVRLIDMDFGQQVYTGRGFADLIRKVENSYGRGNTPQIITGVVGDAQANTGGGGAPPPASPSTDASGMAGSPDGGQPPAQSAAPTNAGTFVIRVERSNQNHRSNLPFLTMNVNMRGSFFTRGWNPDENSVMNKEKALEWLEEVPTAPTKNMPTEEFPKILFFFGDNPETKEF